MRLQLPYDLSNLGVTEDLNRFLSQSVKAIIEILNGRVSFIDNTDTQIVTAIFSTANRTVAIPHTLRRNPTGYITVSLSANMVIFNGDSSNTESLIYLRASAAGTAKLLLF